jgi:hypothetical protein
MGKENFAINQTKFSSPWKGGSTLGDFSQNKNHYNQDRRKVRLIEVNAKVVI